MRNLPAQKKIPVFTTFKRRRQTTLAMSAATTPRTELNTLVIQIGATCGVIKFIGGAQDKPHWSTTGN
jgi:hypothetical protein